MLADALPLDEAHVVAKVVADAEQRVLRVEEVVVPDDRALAGHLAARDAGRERPGEKPVDAERFHEPEVRVDAGDLIAIARQPRGQPRQKDGADVRVAQNVAPRAEHGVVVAIARAFLLRLNRHQADAGAADPAGQPAAGGNRDLLTGVGQPDPPREEQQHLFLGRREPGVAES